MATRYNKLPTEILRDGTTTDLEIFMASAQYQNHLIQRQQNGGPVSPNTLTQEDMLKLLSESEKYE